MTLTLYVWCLLMIFFSWAYMCFIAIWVMMISDSYELQCVISMILMTTWFIHSMFGVYSWFLFYEIIWALFLFECRWSCDFHVFMDSFMFYSLVGGLRTSLQDYHKTSYVILFERAFNYAKIIFKFTFLKTPSFQGRMDGRPCLVCSYWKSI